MKKRILLIAYHFPPLNSVASSRTYAFARYLGELGHEVVVVAPAHRGDSCSYHPDGLGKAYRLVAAGVIDHIDRNQSLLGRSEQRGFFESLMNTGFRLKKQLSYRVIGNFLTSGDNWLRPAVRTTRELCEQWRPDVVISSCSPIATHLAAWNLKRHYPQICWIADYRDLWSDNACVPNAIFPLSLVQQRLESFLNKRASCIVTVSETLQAILQNRCRQPVYIVENGYFAEDVRGVEQDPTNFTKKYTFSATGAIYRQKRDPTPFFRALRELTQEGKLSETDVEIRFYGDNSYLLQEMIAEEKVSPIVSLLPLVSRAESLAIQRGSTGLLFLEADDPVSRGYLTGKLFEYLVSGRPILAVGISLEHEAAKVIARSHTGYVCGNDIGLIKQAIIEIIDGKGVSPDWTEVEKYRRDRLVAKLDKIMAQLTDS